MPSRDHLERVVKGWDDLEKAGGGPAIVDFDCAPEIAGLPAASRFHVLEELKGLATGSDADVASVAQAHLTYLEAFLGRTIELRDYVSATQGCPARGWAPDYVEAARTRAVAALETVGVPWDAQARGGLDALSPAIAPEEVGDVIRGYADKFEAPVRVLTGAEADFDLDVEVVDVEAYWSYWLDGEGQRARLRINRRNASFTQVDAYRFALHEVLGHALQYANLSSVAGTSDVSWPRQLAIHCPHQVLFEGLAQVLPIAASPDDELVQARTRLDHYLQLVNAELHLMINDGTDPSTCRDHAAARVPFWTDGDVASVLRDRALDPQLRSYLWAYPAGIDWFLAAYDAGGSLLTEVLHAGYQRPLVPRELEQLWPAGPRIGGNA